MIGNNLTIWISHCPYTVPTVIRCAIDISADIRHTRHHCVHRLYDLALLSIVIRFATRSILNEGKTTGTVILIASLAVCISNTIKEVFRIKHFMKSLIIVGIRDIALGRD